MPALTQAFFNYSFVVPYLQFAIRNLHSIFIFNEVRQSQTN